MPKLPKIAESEHQDAAMRAPALRGLSHAKQG
jgi:hypothetical protein